MGGGRAAHPRPSAAQRWAHSALAHRCPCGHDPVARVYRDAKGQNHLAGSSPERRDRRGPWSVQCGPQGFMEPNLNLPGCRHTSLSLSPPLLKVLEIYVKCGRGKIVLQNEAHVEASQPPPPTHLPGVLPWAAGGSSGWRSSRCAILPYITLI